MPIKENYIEYVRDLLLRMIDHAQSADAPSTKFQHGIYDARTAALINHMLETLADAILEDEPPRS
jgi:hypothetical protein